jgi:hypothetical protein
MDLLALTFAFYPKVSEDEQIHSCAEKTIERFFGVIDDRLVFVERCIEDHWDRSQTTEFRDQRVITRIRFFVHGLQPARSAERPPLIAQRKSSITPTTRLRE